MKRSIWFFGLLISVLPACEKDDAQPYAELPETIRPLIDKKDCECDIKLGLFKWGDQLLYYPYTRHPGCLMRPLFYDQEGNGFELDADERQDFEEEAEEVQTWSCGEKV